MNRGQMRRLLRRRAQGTAVTSRTAEYLDSELNIAAQHVSLILAARAEINYGRSSYTIAPDGTSTEFPLLGVTDFHTPRDMQGGPFNHGARYINEYEASHLRAAHPDGLDDDSLYMYFITYDPTERARISFSGTVSSGTFRLKFGSSNKKQLVTITDGSGADTFTLTLDGETTGAMDWDSLAATVQAALEGLSTIGAGNVLVTGGAGGPWTVEFIGDLAGTNPPTLSADGTGCTVGISTAHTGATTEDIAYNATAATVQAALEALTDIGTGNVVVTGEAGGPWTVVLAGNLEKLGFDDMTADASGLVGGGTVLVQPYTYTINFLSAPVQGSDFTFIYNLMVPEIPSGLAYDGQYFSVVPEQFHEMIVVRALGVVANLAADPSGQFAAGLSSALEGEGTDAAAQRPSPGQIKR